MRTSAHENRLLERELRALDRDGRPYATRVARRLRERTRSRRRRVRKGTFPTDADYLAQVKKTSVDLGLTIAALAYDASLWSAPTHEALDMAVALGAPILIASAPQAADDPETWGAFTDAVKHHARAAKAHNITLALRNAPGTLCADAAALRRLAKDVDSAWLRYAPDLSSLAPDDTAPLLPKSVIAAAQIDDPIAIPRLERFRAFVLLETPTEPQPRSAYHHKLEAFRQTRLQTLTTP
jgi:hypothetical protein